MIHIKKIVFVSGVLFSTYLSAAEIDWNKLAHPSAAGAAAEEACIKKTVLASYISCPLATGLATGLSLGLLGSSVGIAVGAACGSAVGGAFALHMCYMCCCKKFACACCIDD